MVPVWTTSPQEHQQPLTKQQKHENEVVPVPVVVHRIHNNSSIPSLVLVLARMAFSIRLAFTRFPLPRGRPSATAA